jgi:hypothetical protein
MTKNKSAAPPQLRKLREYYPIETNMCRNFGAIVYPILFGKKCK